MNKMREDMIKAFVASLEQETIPWRKKWAELGVRPCNAVTGNNYRGANVLWLMYMQEEMGYKDNRWCTFKQAQEQGWRIRKGEKGTRIEFWSWYDTEKKKRLDWMEMENLRNELEPDEFIKRVKPMDRVSVVFNAQQIEGIPEQVIPHNILDEDTLMAQREILLKNMSLSFYEGGSKAYYRPSTDSVHMPEISLFENEYSYMATFLHEAGHATGHSSRLNRDMQGTFGSPEYAREELRAEIASAFTAQALGLPGADSSFDNHKAYIQNWIQILKKEPNELFRAINDAEKISDYLMEKGVFEQVREKERELPGKTSSERMEEAGQFNPSQEAVIQDGKKLGLDVTVYADTRFSTAQMLQIYYGLKNGVDAGRYAAPDLNALQMKEIRKGLEAGLDVSLYDNPDLTWDQMFRIRWGLVKGLDASIYADPKYNFDQMKEIQKGLEAGMDVSSYADPKYDSMEMKEIRERLRQSLEPVVTILWSEHSHFHDGDTMSLSEANTLIESLDRATVAEEGYYKTKFRIDFVMDGQPDNYIGRQDLGDGDGTLIDHIESYHAHYENNEKWDNYVLRNEGREALEADKAYRKMLLQEFVPYLKLHNNLSNMERAAMEALQEGGNMTPEETAYHTAMKAYVSECRRLVNQGKYNLPPVPQLKEFDKELAAYTEHVREEIAQEAAAAGMTVEEYAANGYEPYAADPPDPTNTVKDMQEYSAKGQAAPESKTVYYTINEEAARRANDANSFSDYKPGSATAEYRQMVDKAVEIGERQKKRTDPMYHEKIDRIDHNLLDEVAKMELDLRVSAEERLARWSGDYSTFEPVRDGLTNQELQEHLDILRRRQIPSREEIYQGMPEEKKQLYDMNMDYGDREGAERLIEEQRQKLQEEENRTQQRQERSVAAHGKIR